MDLKPLFEHDCGRCKFLGSVTIDDKAADLYFCKRESTVIARFSSKGPDYGSGLCFGAIGLVNLTKGKLNISKHLTVACALALTNGYLSYDVYQKEIAQYPQF